MRKTCLPNVYVPSGLKPQYDVYPLTPALRLGLRTEPVEVTVLSELGFSLTVPDLQSVGQIETTRRVVSTRLFIVNPEGVEFPVYTTNIQSIF